MNRSDLARLAQLASMKRDVDLQDVLRISQQMNALQQDIDRMRSQVKSREDVVHLDPARMTGVDVIWCRWVDQKIRLHQSKMAELAMARELFLGQARKSFGRANALETLTENSRQTVP